MTTQSFILKQTRFEHQPGSVVYEFNGHDYGLVRDDEYATHQRHLAVTLNPTGEGPFFTVPFNDLKAQ